MNKKIFSLLLTIMCCNQVWGQNFTIRITPEAGFDAIDTIYNEFNNNEPQSILTILNTIPPKDVRYLIQNRPTGNLLELMTASPDWESAQLARMMIVEYPYPVDVSEVLENFEDHSSLEVVYYDYNLDPINFIPTQVTDREPITMELAFLPFLNCQVPTTNNQGLAYDVEIIGNTINLFRVGSSPFPSTTICFPQATTMYSYEIGRLAAGVYSINIFNVFNGTDFPVGLADQYLIGQTTLEVQGTEPMSVPVLNFSFLLMMGMLFGWIGFCRLSNYSKTI